jgi:hypothetical protein
MIIFLYIWLVGWSLAMLLRRAARTAPDARDAPFKQRTSRDSALAGPEDGPAGWPATAVRGDWAELDERQLIRLLTESTQ